MLLSFGVVATAAVERAQCEVAVSGQRTHPELVGPGVGLGVVPLG
jgi:hypothetical protein